MIKITKKQNRCLFGILFFSSLLFLQCPTFAIDLKKHKKDLDEIDVYLLSARTISAHFKQISSNETSEGFVYIDKNKNNLCIDYISQNNPVRLLSLNGKDYYIDKELKTVNKMATTAIISRALLIDTLNNSDFVIKSINSDQDKIRISFFFAKEESQGLITIIFKKSPMTLISIFVKDIAGGEDVEVFLDQNKTNIKIDNKIFQKKIK